MDIGADMVEIEEDEVVVREQEEEVGEAREGEEDGVVESRRSCDRRRARKY